MLATWGAIRKSLSCESNTSEVYDPEVSMKSSCIRKCRSGYSSKSISRFRGVVDGSKRRRMKMSSQSPLSIRSSELINPITHQVRFDNATCELKITRADGGVHRRSTGLAESCKSSSPGSRMFHGRNSPDLFSGHSSGSLIAGSQQIGSLGSRITTCEKCGENLKRWEDAEAHHFCKHSVTELVEGEPSRNIIERIVQTGRSSPKNCFHTSRILKIHNLQTTLAQFEEYREIVKIKAHQLSKKHPRCLADGNELLRFYAATFTCSLGENNSPTLCRSNKCNVCYILKHGFTANKASSSGNLLCVFTASTAEEAYKHMQQDEETRHLSKALILCRVIAGRVQKPADCSLDKAVESGFDSVAGKSGLHYNIERLYSLDPNALLPCFVIVC